MSELTMSQFATQADYWKARAEEVEQAARTWENEAERRSRRYEEMCVAADTAIQRAEADARRYRWLRDTADGWRVLKFDGFGMEVGNVIDAAIDAELAKEKP